MSIRKSGLLALVFWLCVGIGIAFADVYIPPAKDRAVTDVPSVSANAYPTATASVNPSQALSIDETDLAISPGGGGSQFYTGPCVVPKTGGFLKRGFGIILLRADQAVEVDQVCVAHLREMERIAADQEQQRIELERQRLVNERLMLEVRLGELAQK